MRRNLELLACALMGGLVLVSMIPVLLDIRLLTDSLLLNLYTFLGWLPMAYLVLLVVLLRLAQDARQRVTAVAALALLYFGSPGRLGSFGSLTLVPIGLLLLANSLTRSAPAWHPKGLKNPFSIARLAAIFLAIIFVLAVGLNSSGLRYDALSFKRMSLMAYGASMVISISFGAGLFRHVSQLLRNAPRELEEEVTSSAAF